MSQAITASHNVAVPQPSTSRTAVPRVAFYARVSSELQAQEQTIASQVAALKERIAAEGLTLDEELSFLDDGVSGTTLTRPALERLRDVAYSGGFQKLDVHSPDRLARKYASQVLLVDELRRHGDDHLQASFFGRRRVLAHPLRRAMRGNDPRLTRHTEFSQNFRRMSHRFPIRLTPHDDADERLFV